MIKHKLFAFIVHFGYVGIFGSLVLGIIGLPVPDEFLMTFAGYWVSRGKLLYVPTILVAGIGSFTGMSVSYWIGRKFGYPLVEKYGRKIHLTKEKLDSAERWFERFGKFALTIGYFIPGVRHLTAYSAGISKWSYRSFSLYAVPGALLWAVVFITLGKYLGAHWRVVTETIHRYLLFGLVVLIAAAAGFWLVKKAKGRKVKAT